MGKLRTNYPRIVCAELTSRSYAATWGTVAFLVPTEIFPSDLRAQGNGFGITGWAIGVGMTTLVNPIMFKGITVRPVTFGAFIYDIDIVPEPNLFPLHGLELDLDPYCLSL